MANSKIYSYYDPDKGLVSSHEVPPGGGGTYGFQTLGGGSSFGSEALFPSGLSGSLTQLTDGSPYLVAGADVEITTGSSGAVTINAIVGAASSGAGWFAPSLNVISTSGSVFFGVDYGTTNPDITFGDNGAANFNVQGNPAGDFKVSSDNKAGALLIDGGTEQIGLLTDGTSAADAYGLNASTDPIPADTGLFVSGAIGSKDSAVKGTSVFGGDMVVSGALVANGLADGAYPAIKIDKDYTGTTSAGSLFSQFDDATGLTVDYDVTGVVASGQTVYHDAIAVHYNQDAPTMVGTCNATGADIRMTGGTSGVQTLKGLAINVSGAPSNTTTGIDITLPNDSTHFIARSPDALLDFFKISVGASGATTITTSDDGGTAADLTLNVEGKITLDADDELILDGEGGITIGKTAIRSVDFNADILDIDALRAITIDSLSTIGIGTADNDYNISIGTDGQRIIALGNSDGATGIDIDAGLSGIALDSTAGISIGGGAGDEVVFNEAGVDVDFRVETNSDSEAIFLNSGAKILHINKGKQAFETKIWNNSDNALEVNSSGVVINEEKHAQNDFRAETVNKTHALFVDSSTDQVIFHSGSAVPTDVSFYVSGSTSAPTGISLFGGDLVVSGNMYIETVSSVTTPIPLFMKDNKVVFQLSDARLKANLRNIEDPLDKVMALKGYRYNAVDDLSGPDCIGFLAQEVESIVPELAHTYSDGYMGVKYAETTALLVEAIKELKGEVNRLGSELETTKLQLTESHNKVVSRIVELDTDVDKVFENLTAYVDQKHDKNEG